jgi:hypothetical protein
MKHLVTVFVGVQLKGVIGCQVLKALVGRLFDRGMGPELGLFNYPVGLVLQGVAILNIFSNGIAGRF